jgi:hypothetical protein
MADATPTPPIGRKFRNIKEIHRLDGTTWYGTILTTIATALRELDVDGKLQLLEDLRAHVERQHREILRHQRDRPRGWR